MWQAVKTFPLIVLLFALSACDVGSPDQSVTDEIVAAYYQAMIAGDIDQAQTYFSTQRLPEEWSSHLQDLKQQMGGIKSFKIKNTEINTMLRGRLYTYDVSVQYDKGPAAEVVSLFNAVDSDETSIVSHTISADGYRKP